MRRILVIGQSGAGKSVLATELGKRLGLKVIHLDVYFWRRGWVETPLKEWTGIVDALLVGEEWIMDGNYNDTLPKRMSAADTVIFLDYSRYLCIWRAVRRWFIWRNRRRADLADGCYENFDLEFYRWIWNFPKNERPRVIEILNEHRNRIQIFHLKHPREAEEMLGEIPNY
jgi:adenylate kinase family enzyme